MGVVLHRRMVYRRVELLSIPGEHRQMVMSSIAGCEGVSSIACREYTRMQPHKILSDELYTDSALMFEFTVRATELTHVMTVLHEVGLGQQWGEICVLPVVFTTKPAPEQPEVDCLRKKS